MKIPDIKKTTRWNIRDLHIPSLGGESFYFDSVPEQKLHFNYSFLTLIMIVQDLLPGTVRLFMVNLPSSSLIRINYGILVLMNFFGTYD